MPLEFESLSHGKVAFGFFNIETDMILLNHYFVFAEDFCRYLSETAEKYHQGPYEALWDVWVIEDQSLMGNLMGAIYGVDLRGFIGEVYRLFPFPEDRNKFRQNPEGFATRPVIEALIVRYGYQRGISFTIDPKRGRVHIGEFVFGRNSFHELLQYVWLGGYPRWKNRARPDYVMTMKARIEQARSDLFKGVVFREE